MALRGDLAGCVPAMVKREDAEWEGESEDYERGRCIKKECGNDGGTLEWREHTVCPCTWYAWSSEEEARRLSSYLAQLIFVCILDRPGSWAMLVDYTSHAV